MNRPHLHSLYTGPIAEGLKLLPAHMNTLPARAQMLKMCLQESLGIHRDQLEKGGKNVVIGPALGLWQFERGGACTALLKHAATKGFVRHLCAHFGIEANPDAVWRALKVNDVFAAAMARINLYWLPQALPDIHDEQGGFEQYIEAWQPGAFKRDPVGVRKKWHLNHIDVIDYLLDTP